MTEKEKEILFEPYINNLVKFGVSNIGIADTNTKNKLLYFVCTGGTERNILNIQKTRDTLLNKEDRIKAL